MKDHLLVSLGAIGGGIAGYFAFAWLLRYGLYGLVLPGGLLGFGAGIAKNRSIALAACCGTAATALGVFAEWRNFPFQADESLSYFIMHLYDLRAATVVMIALGGAIGFWIPFRRIEPNPLAPGIKTKGIGE